MLYLKLIEVSNYSIYYGKLSYFLINSTSFESSVYILFNNKSNKKIFFIFIIYLFLIKWIKMN